MVFAVPVVVGAPIMTAADDGSCNRPRDDGTEIEITVPVSAEVHAGLRAATDDIPAYVAELVARDLRLRRMADETARHQREHGPFTPEELAAADDELRGAFGDEFHRVSATTTVVLDSEGLFTWLADDRKAAARMEVIRECGAQVVVCANSIIEVSQAGVSLPRLSWLLSQIRVVPVTERLAVAGAGLLRRTGLSGHEHALDAAIAQIALDEPRPVMMLTSNVDAMAKLCGNEVELIAV